jgi:hypothetical protein
MQPSSSSSASAAITIAPVDSGRSPLFLLAFAVPAFVNVSVAIVFAGVLVAGVAAPGGVVVAGVGVTGVVVAPSVVAAGVVVAPGVAPPEGTYVVVGVLDAGVVGALVAPAALVVVGTLVAAVLTVAASAPAAETPASSSASSAAQSDALAVRVQRDPPRRRGERRPAGFIRVVAITRPMLTVLTGALAEQIV